jgi:hypothetical protein
VVDYYLGFVRLISNLFAKEDKHYPINMKCMFFS